MQSKEKVPFTGNIFKLKVAGLVSTHFLLLAKNKVGGECEDTTH